MDLFWKWIDVPGYFLEAPAYHVDVSITSYRSGTLAMLIPSAGQLDVDLGQAV